MTAFAGTALPERPDRKQSRLDAALLNAWGKLAPRAFAPLQSASFGRLVRRVNELEPKFATMTDLGLLSAARDLRNRITVKPISPEGVAEAFSIVREAARRHRGQRHFPVQLIGGAVMLRGAVAEMATGEGKSLTALLPAITMALTGRPVHIITVNDYLARRDAEEFGPVFAALGLQVGVIHQGQPAADRQRAYSAEVTYCTSKELVFDYLRDRLTLGGRWNGARLAIGKLRSQGANGAGDGCLLRGLHVAIVDEADSVLLDEARTPLILSGPDETSDSDEAICATALDMAKRLQKGTDFEILADENSVRLTPEGAERVAVLASELAGAWVMRRARDEIVRQALTATYILKRDTQYIVADGKIQIVDEYTGRVMPDRSWEHGMHQMIEAKEGCDVTRRYKTLARITYQQFFRRYHHLCGMTGTGLDAAGELRSVFGLRVMRVPPNRPCRRHDMGARMLSSSDERWAAVVEAARAACAQGRAVLIGTRSVGASEHVGALLVAAGLKPVVLNARQDRSEAEIVAGAGQPGRLTVATNMAGRGTDIRLHPAVRDAGGLHVILTEYHDSPRIDRQLFGRAGRQADPGSCEAIVALDDELFRRFTGARLVRLLCMVSSRQRRVPAAPALLLRRYCQWAAERLHARSRRNTVAEDRRLREALGFAGGDQL